MSQLHKHAGTWVCTHVSGLWSVLLKVKESSLGSRLLVSLDTRSRQARCQQWWRGQRRPANEGGAVTLVLRFSGRPLVRRVINKLERLIQIWPKTVIATADSSSGQVQHDVFKAKISHYWERCPLCSSIKAWRSLVWGKVSCTKDKRPFRTHKDAANRPTINSSINTPIDDGCSFRHNYR